MSDVSRETPPVPPQARGVFSSARMPLAERYAALLASDGVDRGLIGPREVPRIWQRHLLNCAALEPMLPAGSGVADVGTGAGLPGIVLSLARPDLRITLIEPLLRRVVFLEQVVAELGLDQVEVVRSRAEQLHGSRRFDVVTSRALAPLERLLGWCMPLVEPSGCVLAMKGASASQEVASTRAWAADQGWSEPEVLENPAADSSPVRAVRVGWKDPSQVSLRLSTAPAASNRRAAGVGPAPHDEAGDEQPGERGFT